MIATPAYSGSLTVEYVGAVFANCADLAGKGVIPYLEILPGNCYVSLARNEIVSLFLKSDATHLLFWDDDVGAPDNGAYRLLQWQDCDVVAGVYPKKTEKPDYPVRLLEGMKPGPVTGLVECEGLPTGFMLIKREVIEKMIEAYPERRFVDPVNGNVHYDLFACERVGETWWGEDYRFCQLARQQGFRLWADPSLELRHVGRQVWNGRLQDHLEGANAKHF